MVQPLLSLCVVPTRQGCPPPTAFGRWPVFKPPLVVVSRLNVYGGICDSGRKQEPGTAPPNNARQPIVPVPYVIPTDVASGS